MRFIVNLLPLLENAAGLRRVVSVFAGGYEGPVVTTDWQGMRVGYLNARGHTSSIVTLGLEAVADKAPGVSFIHVHPGPVNTNMLHSMEGIIVVILTMIWKAIAKFIAITVDESGERQVFLATSGRYPPKSSGGKPSGVAVGNAIPAVVKGTTGKVGSGVYSLGVDGEGPKPRAEKVLAGLRDQDMAKRVWEHTVEEWVRITGRESI